MPLQDHFSMPLSAARPWDGFHSAWATMIAQELNRILPVDYVAIPQTSRGPMIEVDVATLQVSHGTESSASSWAPGEPAWSGPIDWPERDLFEVQILDQRRETRLVGAVELISPANKDRPAARQAFAGKCAGYLRAGVGLVIVDVVTIRRQNLHRLLLELLELDSAWKEDDPVAAPLYAAAYRTEYHDTNRLAVWLEQLRIGDPLPTLPLWLAEETVVPINLETSYSSACTLLRIPS